MEAAANIEVEFESESEAWDFWENQLESHIERSFDDIVGRQPKFDKFGEISDDELPSNLEVLYKEDYDEYVGNKGNNPSIVIHYSTYGSESHDPFMVILAYMNNIYEFCKKFREDMVGLDFYVTGCTH